MRTAVLLGLALATACKASVSAEAKASTNGDEEVADFDQPLEQPTNTETTTEPPEPSEGQALLGARHDLAYKGPATAKCQCLVAALGNPNDAAFEWATAPPQTDTNQLVIAISTGGEPCPKAPSDTLGPSYWGYELHGNDVVVIIENAVLGRPITTGAIIPKPIGDGQVYLRPRDQKVPYGGGLDRTGQCKVGNPGPPRTAPPRRAMQPNTGDGTTTSEVPPIE